MKLELNKKTITVAPGINTLAELLAAEGLDAPGQAVAVNLQLAPRAQWSAIELKDDMKITVIRAVCGG